MVGIVVAMTKTKLHQQKKQHRWWLHQKTHLGTVVTRKKPSGEKKVNLGRPHGLLFIPRQHVLWRFCIESLMLKVLSLITD